MGECWKKGGRIEWRVMLGCKKGKWFVREVMGGMNRWRLRGGGGGGYRWGIICLWERELILMGMLGGSGLLGR